MSDHGRFIWYELMTPDMAGAKAFYGSVVGWRAQDMPGDGMAYSVLDIGGDGVGGVMPLSDEHRAAGIPPNWTGYVAVDDVDASAAKVKALGGQVMREPADIPGVGRFAVIADPAGAVLAIMTSAPMETPRDRPPMGALGQTGWHELYGAEPDQGFGFYADLFGWTKSDVMDMGEMGPYQLFDTPDGQTGGMMRKPDNVPVACWLYYFAVGDIDAAIARVTAGGGQVLMPPMEVPGDAWVMQGQDPQGAMFALMGTRAAT